MIRVAWMNQSGGEQLRITHKGNRDSAPKKEEMRSTRKNKGKTRLRQNYCFVNPVKMRSLPSVRCYLHHLQTSLAPGLSQESWCALLILRLINGSGNMEALRRTLLFPQERGINESRKWAVKSLHESLGMTCTCSVHSFISTLQNILTNC